GSQPRADQAIRNGGLALLARDLLAGGGGGAAGRVGGDLPRAAPRGLARKVRRAAHRLRRAPLQRGVSPARRAPADDPADRADLRRTALHAPVQDQREGRLHRRGLAVAPGLRHLAARRRDARAAGHEHRRLPGRGDGRQRAADADPSQPEPGQPASGARHLHHLLPALDPGREGGDGAGGGGRHRRAHREAGRAADVPRQPGPRLGAEHHPVSAADRVPDPQRGLEPHPQADSAGVDRPHRLHADRAGAGRRADAVRPALQAGGGV
ncbi:MAG: putative L-proline 4-hydroxylase, partial [uncultured Acetobacteraceae bacterium]